ncbi:MAG: tRNA threonylcarbamoyladenosine dehydratase [Anaerovibrio sp.]|uniref:tRNA threonylcarbamoyladenosine dehydratase n=1 Tax=Anaerovibrio sp. TaxID=1872532 RepID=UPI0025DD257C|nr:tRNA threonylcarbamoyladenosine dehydratase [Anaerovibrio sp.]MCR5176424.1 tRNA threonylcarbamoyladenosine dehydratase [Anaerovibrio sp.]
MNKENIFSRTELLIGKAALSRLHNSRVAVFGIGGVGSYTVEALARCGIGHFLLVDDDVISISNINRQLHALCDTVGRLKTEVMAERIKAINPDAEVETRAEFYLPENSGEFFDGSIDYIVDAVDTVAAKIDLAVQAERRGIPIISSMGAGNKLNPAGFQVTDIYKTSVCPLARVMRHKLRQLGVKGLKVVYSTEEPIRPLPAPDFAQSESGTITRRSVPGSVSFVPSVAGLIAAGEVIKDLCSDGME